MTRWWDYGTEGGQPSFGFRRFGRLMGGRRRGSVDPHPDMGPARPENRGHRPWVPGWDLPRPDVVIWPASRHGPGQTGESGPPTLGPRMGSATARCRNLAGRSPRAGSASWLRSFGHPPSPASTFAGGMKSAAQIAPSRIRVVVAQLRPSTESGQHLRRWHEKRRAAARASGGRWRWGSLHDGGDQQRRCGCGPPAPLDGACERRPLAVGKPSRRR